jgi:Ca2+-binding RTX toxin-like protein
MAMPKPPPTTPNYFPGTTGDDILDIRGNTADCTVDGRAGNDTIYGGDGHDTLLGGNGNDLIYASVDDTLIDGGGGTDTVSFADFSDVSGKGVYADLLGGILGLGGPANGRANVLVNVEKLVGSNYADLLAGNRSSNLLDGGAGNDSLRAWGSGDFLTGGGGADKFDVSGVGNGSVTITDFHYNEGDRIRIEGGATFNWVSGVGQDAQGNVQQAWIGTCDIQFGGTLQVIVLGADTAPSPGWITGATIFGTEGDDTLVGGPAEEELRGFGGNDLLNGGAGADTMYGGSGNDRYVIDHSSDLAVELVGAGDDWALTSVSYALASGSAIETLSTTNAASTAALALTGNEFGNSIYGNAGPNLIAGGGGNDYLVGIDGADTLDGGPGNDGLEGGPGADVYLFSGAPGNDVIFGFETGTDRIDFSAYGITQDQLTTAANGNDTIISVDSNGDGTADFSITLVGVQAPLQGDYVF